MWGFAADCPEMLSDQGRGDISQRASCHQVCVWKRNNFLRKKNKDSSPKYASRNHFRHTLHCFRVMATKAKASPQELHLPNLPKPSQTGSLPYSCFTNQRKSKEHLYGITSVRTCLNTSVCYIPTNTS